MNKVLYQIYPLGFCGCERENNLTAPVNRIKKIIDWIPYLKDMGFNVLYLNPVFQSDRHGYDTRDYTTIDYRLGTNKDFKEVCDKLHENNIQVILDAVFNHVGRGFWAFQDVLKNKENSKYKDWFYIDLNYDTSYKDGFYYDTWEKHFELVKLNLNNKDVREYLFNAVEQWIKEFNIDGLRLDVAYCLPKDFLYELKNRFPQLFIFGEIVDNDYNFLDCMDSFTNYSLYANMITKEKDFLNYINLDKPEVNLINFLDNHDVSRFSTLTKDPNKIKMAYTYLLMYKGFPCIYYGSEWGIGGEKKDFDYEIRPEIDHPETNELSEFVKKLININLNTENKIESIYYHNNRLIFRRGDALVLMNFNDTEYEFYEYDNGYNLSGIFGEYVDLLNGEKVRLEDRFILGPNEIKIIK